MESTNAIASLSALAQPTRLEAFRLLIHHEPVGLPAGELARLLDVPQNTMSAHLATLSRAGRIDGERQSRSIIYRANLDHFQALTLFLLKAAAAAMSVCAHPSLPPLHPAAILKRPVND